MQTLNHSPVHGTAVAVGGRGFLFLGPSGSGKSGLALKMIALGAELISDDQVVLTCDGEQVQMSAPKTLKDQVEARGLGILRVRAKPVAALAHVVDMSAEPSARMPQLAYCDVMGVRIDLINGQNVPNLASILIILGRNARQI